MLKRDFFILDFLVLILLQISFVFIIYYLLLFNNPYISGFLEDHNYWFSRYERNGSLLTVIAYESVELELINRKRYSSKMKEKSRFKKLED